MATMNFEVVLNVADYFDEEERDEGLEFEEAQEDNESAERIAKEEIKETLGLKKFPKEVKVRSEFIEFDSSNTTHAGAYFNIIVQGPIEIIDKLKAALTDSKFRENTMKIIIVQDKYSGAIEGVYTKHSLKEIKEVYTDDIVNNEGVSRTEARKILRDEYKFSTVKPMELEHA